MEIEDPAAAVAAPKPRKVPQFDSDSDRREMSAQQRAFYLDDFLPGLLAGNPVDVQGNSGYAGELTFELIEQRRTEPVTARERLQALIEAYRPQDLPHFADRALADFCFLEGNFASGYAAMALWANPSLHLSLVEHLGHPRGNSQPGV